jgi:4-hydroxy 2-oxovalerate aldolase
MMTGTARSMVAVMPLPPERVSELEAEVAAWGSADVLYFADSLGSMTDIEIRTVYEAIASGWGGPIGIHVHDNRGRALINTLVAAELGATWLDATVLGMGRRAGNVRTDFLLFELSQAGADRYRPEALLPVALGSFRRLQDEHQWGTNLLYMMYDAGSL